ncbi:ThiJ/PfpI family protein [Desulfurella amilsii]|uniref:ThiJ/PfpI family protein n=1 Tax=Desulfurella amilsii TaxID=1562698 RepID=A0A1X4XVF9_9BACT|nr:DJ-1/PfpI family protein [Desulfurella amilsii]OSS41522.1 ThiJ/PfpI family protein [Desulfurella amilsii]
MAKKVLMLVGDYVEDYEVMVPFQMLQMVGLDTHCACPNKRAGEFVKTAIHDFEGDQTYSEKRGHNFMLNCTFEDIKPESFDALVLPGGRAPEYIRLDNRVIEIVKHFSQSKKPIAAICHGPQILVAADAVEGYELTAYPALKPDIVRAGGKWVDPNQTFSNACVDRNLVTAPAWPAHPEWIRKFLEVLDVKISL